MQWFAIQRKKAQGNKWEATMADSESLALTKADYEKAMQALASVKLAVATEGAKAFALYGNLLSDEAQKALEKIIQAQVTSSPWEDIY